MIGAWKAGKSAFCDGLHILGNLLFVTAITFMGLFVMAITFMAPLSEMESRVFTVRHGVCDYSLTL